MATRAVGRPTPPGRARDPERFLAPLMLAPAILYIVALLGVPLALAIYYAFTNITTGGAGGKFVGLSNFTSLIGDPTFMRALANSFLFSGTTLIGSMVLGTIQAELLMRPFHGKWIVRFLILLPWTAPAALSVIAWLWMFDSVFSPIDWVLRQIGLLGSPGALFGVLPDLYWLGDKTLAPASIILVSIWRILPLATVIILAGLSSIPKEVHEQALVDRAGYFRRLFQINLPMAFSIFMVAILFTFVFTFSSMVEVFILTRGGPAASTHVLPSLAFFRGIRSGALGQGAAIALFMFPVLAGVSAIILTLIRRREQ